MEPINAVYIMEESILGDTEQEDSVSVPILERLKDEIQEKNDASVMEKPLFGQRVQSKILVRSSVNNYSVSNHSSGSITSTAGPLNHTCAICLQNFSTWELLIKNVFSHILNIKSPLHICHLCGKVFLNLSLMYAHNFLHRKKTIFKDPSLIKLSCTFCAQTLSCCSLIKHVFSHISAISAPSYVCTYCSGGFEDTAKLHFHKCISRTSQRGYFNCKKSSYSYNQKLPASKFQTDKTEESVTTYSCANKIHFGQRPNSGEDCGKSFTNYYILRQHNRLHPSGRPFSCDICGKSFIKRSYLIRHWRIHSGERPISCDICGKSFKQSEHFKNQRIHSGERPFYCYVCGKSFTESGRLKIHQRTHSGERPFSCDVCGKLFMTSGHLSIHQRIHSGERPFSCDICGKKFTVSGHLKRHQRIHSGERQFSCYVCGKSFARSENLKKHQRFH